ncbi:MAG: pyruvate, phosphate dikinase [Solirubrobacteraceae bacterium]
MEAATQATKYVYDFSEGSRDDRELLGGKGAGIAEMTRILGAHRVPAGFTITTEACVAYMTNDRSAPRGLADQISGALARLEQLTGLRLGDDSDPLLVSVRSGARESMPGMLDTVLNLGLTERSVEALAARTSNARFAWDSYRRLVQMFGNVVHDIPGEAFEQEIAASKERAGVSLDTELGVEDLRALTDAFQHIYRRNTGEVFPQDPRIQLEQAVHAVFDSWLGDRAVAYRRINRIPDAWGTAVNVQQMVFGNKGESSGSGVAFSRDEVTGESVPSGDFLTNAQGEDVVSGVRNTRDLAELGEVMPGAHAELLEVLRTLERHYGDMQDVEFTIEEGHLYLLQTRNAKRPAQAAVQFAVDAVSEGLLDRAQAIATIDADSLDALLHPTFDSHAEVAVAASGVAASPGAAKGEVVFTAAEAVAAAAEQRAVILVRPFTEAEDVAGFHAARGILTSEGGKASHAALVARGMGRPCVCGASELEIDLETRTVRIGERTIHAGEQIAIDGSAGIVTLDDVPLVQPQPSEHFKTVLEWADQLRRMGVRTNADSPADAVRAREFGAEGIGLCRTEHMFIAEDRQPKMQRMILAHEEAARREALEELLPLQQADFEGLFEAMAGLPVTIRLLDPPLHEFLPNQDERMQAIQSADGARLEALEQTLDSVRELKETNPMLGTRGCRLGIIYPEIYEMQVEAIMLAARAVRQRSGSAPHLEIMVPLVDYEQELELMSELIVRIGDKHQMTRGEDYAVGTMIELPRACLAAAKIALSADFFSFGTNDLTQTTLGFSRDDVETRFLAIYLERKIIDRSPFETLDTPGVGALLKLAAERGRSARPKLKLGVCGEHGGDPDSIEFFEGAGIDYVSCSPFRVPVARVAAAQSAIRARAGSPPDQG